MHNYVFNMNLSEVRHPKMIIATDHISVSVSKTQRYRKKQLMVARWERGCGMVEKVKGTESTNW